MNVNFNFENKKFIVTGASSGIGREITLELAKAGAFVFAIGRNVERLTEVKDHYPNKIAIKSVDVCNYEELENAFDEFVFLYGKINGGVYSAGLTQITPLKNYDVNSAKNMMQVNFWSAIEFLRLITKAKYGVHETSTVILSSNIANSCERGMFAYSASKAAINAAIRSAAKEICQKGHRVNTILPGRIKSPMTEKLNGILDEEKIISKHLLGEGVPSDISGMTLFLLSGSAKWITGSNIVVDGGYLA